LKELLMNTFPSKIATLCILGLAGVTASPAEAQDPPPNDVFIEASVETSAAPQEYPAPAQQPPQQPAAYGQPIQAQPAQPVYAQPGQPVYPQAHELPLQHRRLNTIYVEGFGGGLWWSLNYERLVLQDLAVRAGFGYIGLEGFDPDGSSASVGFFSIPISVSYLGLGGTSHMFEVGAGLTIAGYTGSVRSGLSTSSGSGATAFGQVFGGYRYHPSGHAGFNFRAGVLALLGRGLGFTGSDPDSIGALPWPYVSGGLSF
jgi:hypothetical protein